MSRYASFLIALVLAGCGGGAGTPGAITPPTGGSASGVPAGGQIAAPVSARTLFVGTSNHTIETFNEVTGNAIGQINPPGLPETVARSLVLSPDSHWLYAALSPLYGCSYGASTVVKIDATTDAVDAATTTPDAFNDAVLSADGSTFAGVAGSSQNSSGAFTTAVDVFSTADMHLIKHIPIPGAQIPWQLAISADGSTVYVTDTNSFSMNVYKVAVSTGSVTQFYAFPAKRTFAVLRPFLDATGQKLFVQTSAGFTILDANTASVIGTIGYPDTYYDAAQTSDRNTLLAIGGGALTGIAGSLISTVTDSVESTFNGKDPALSAAVSPDGAVGFDFIQNETGTSTYTNVDVFTLPGGALQSVAHITPSTAFITAVAGE